jgi:hypothetical protein
MFTFIITIEENKRGMKTEVVLADVDRSGERRLCVGHTFSNIPPCGELHVDNCCRVALRCEDLVNR